MWGIKKNYRPDIRMPPLALTSKVTCLVLNRLVERFRVTLLIGGTQ